jgi:hypothetical protein
MKNNNKELYFSYSEFRKAHLALLRELQSYREEGKDIKDLTDKDKIPTFLNLGAKTGCILQDEDIRSDCQSWLDTWTSTLQKEGYRDFESIILEKFNLDKYAEYIADGKITKTDIKIFRELLHQDGVGNLQFGKYNINISEGKDIYIGDRIYQDADAEVIRKVLLEFSESRKFKTLLTQSEYLARMENVAKSYQATYKGGLAGRKDKQEEIKQHFDNNAQVIVLHGAGGLGKTRLLLSLSEILPTDISLWYVRNEAESVESELVNLDRASKHIIVIDDAHHCPLLSYFREILVNPDFANKVVLVLATRSIFKESVVYELGIRSGISEIEIKPLKDSDIDELLQSNPYEINNLEARHELVRIAEGNPLIAGVAARLHQKGEDLRHLSNQELLTRYFEEIIQDLSDIDNHIDKRIAKKYLQLIAVLGSIDLSDGELTDKICEVLSTNHLEVENLVSPLIESGLVEQYGSLIRLSSEVLADRLLLMLLDTQGGRNNNQWRKLIEPFFTKKAKQILSNLAAAEIKGESIEAGLFVGQKLDEFRKGLRSEGNIFRYSLLDLFEEVAYFRPDDILIIISEIVDAPELLPETIEYQNWGMYSITHEMVLTKVVEVLARTIYRGGLEDAIDYLHKLATYQPSNHVYTRVRDGAKSALVKIAAFNQDKPFYVQFLLLEKISVWLEQEFTLNLSLCLSLIHVMLQISFHWTKTDPTQPHTLVLQQGNLSVSKDLERIRDRALEILYTAYRQATDTFMRLSIVQELHNAAPYLDSRYNVDPSTTNCVRNNSIKTANFFLEIVDEAEFPILDKIIDWLNEVKRFYEFEDKIFFDLRTFLKQHKGLQLYRMLVDGWKWDQENEDIDWEESEKLRINKINEYINTITLSRIDIYAQELESIVAQSYQAKKDDVRWICNLLRTLGHKKPHIAQKLIQIIMDENLHLKNYLGCLLAGISLEEQELAISYVKDWVSSNHKFLWKAVAVKYNVINWTPEDLDQVENVMKELISKDDLEIDLLLIRNMYQLAEFKPETAIEILKILSARSHELVVYQVAETISHAIYQKRTWLSQFLKYQDFLDIIQNFERLSRLDHDVQMCLQLLGETHPMEVIKFVERRILAKQDRYSRESYYEAFPFGFSDMFDGVRKHPDFPDVLRYVREWTLKIRENYFLYDAAPRLLSALSLSLEGELYNCFMEWVQSKEEDKIKAIASTLRQFNSGEIFYEICREIIIQAKGNEEITSYVSSAIYTTPGVISGGFSLFYKKRREEISQWLKDPNPHVRQFIQTLDMYLTKSIESEEAREKLEERNWR